MSAPSELRLGRDPGNDLILDAPGVSRRHAALVWEGGSPQPVIADLGSVNGTFVNGELLARPRLLGADDLVFLGGFVLRVEGRHVAWHNLNASRLSAWNLRREAAGRVILKDVSLAINPCEFVGLMGPSGCSKSTLMDALSGLRPAAAGAVYVNELDLYRHFNALRRSLGHVPQRDELPELLSVERTLYYAARLRLPAAPQAELHATVDEVVRTVGLESQRETPFRHLSGGQQKRLSLGIELTTKPSFIFLDEPTSPLDPLTTDEMMRLFRRLADAGRIVVMVTHKFEQFELMHRVALLAPGGRLAFFGPPAEALDYFGCRAPHEIYRRLAEHDPDGLSRRFESSPHYARHVGERIAAAREIARTTVRRSIPAGARRQGARRWGVGQWLTLTRRCLELKRRDVRAVGLLLAQAAVVSLLVATIIPGGVNDAKILFIAAVVACWFGANNAVREIVAEAAVYRRERQVSLKIPSYVGAKFTVLALVAVPQCALLLGVLTACDRLRIDDWPLLAPIFYLTLLGGAAMGLCVSAVVSSTEKAVGLLPLLVIPQLLLGGFLAPLADIHLNLSQGWRPATAEEVRRYEQAQSLLASPSPPPASPPATGQADEIKKMKAGMGAAARLAADAVLVRWTLDALAHAVSLSDEQARRQLPGQLTVAEHRLVDAAEFEATLAADYRRRVAEDLCVLGVFVVVPLALALLALRRQDVL
jgi:ABC-type multidrug transport system ATPase subunit